MALNTARTPLTTTRNRDELGLTYVQQQLDIICPLGSRALKEAPVYFPGEEDALSAEFDRIAAFISVIGAHAKETELIKLALMCLKDIDNILEKCKNGVLSPVEFFEVKNLLLKMEEIAGIAEKIDEFPHELRPEDIGAALDILDPQKERLATFYIYDEFSEKLAALRSEKKELEKEARRIQKAGRDRIKEKYGVILTPKFDITASKGDRASVAKLDEIAELARVEEDYVSVRFALIAGAEVDEIGKRIDEIAIGIEDEELAVCEDISRKLSPYIDRIKENCSKLGRIDLILAKAAFAIKRGCVRPELSTEHVIEFTEGRQLQVEDMLSRRGHGYCPINMALKDGVSCITGANMGGKTVSLKLAGLMAIMAQNGFFVPAKSARIGLSSSIRILVGDSQSIERGLSSFGSEMEELKEILDRAQPRALILIDEIASGTNPQEGQALTRSLIDFLLGKAYISLLTTHYEAVSADNADDIQILQVRGLADVNFTNLERELAYANRKQRIEIIGKYMDYRLYRVRRDEQNARDALNIAKMLGLPDEITEGAKKYL